MIAVTNSTQLNIGRLAGVVIGACVVVAGIWIAYEFSRQGEAEIALREEHAVEGTFVLRQVHGSGPFTWVRNLLWSKDGCEWIVYYMGHEELAFADPTFELNEGVLMIQDSGEQIGLLNLSSGQLDSASGRSDGPISVLKSLDPLSIVDQVEIESLSWEEGR